MQRCSNPVEIATSLDEAGSEMPVARVQARDQGRFQESEGHLTTPLTAVSPDLRVDLTPGARKKNGGDRLPSVGSTWVFSPEYLAKHVS